MGQHQTHPSPTLQTAMETSRYQEKLKFALNLKSHSSQEAQTRETSCLNVFCSPKSNQKEPEWKKFMLKKLDNPILENWSGLLVPILKRQDTPQADEIYQADLQWASYANSDSDKSQQRDLSEGFVLNLYDEPQAEGQDTVASNKGRKTCDSMQEQFTSGLKSAKSWEAPSEEILVQTKDPEWMKESFDIRVPEDRAAMVLSIQRYRSSGRASSCKNTRFSRKSARISNRRSSPVKTYRSHYENFTLIIEPVPENVTPDGSRNVYQDALGKYKSVLGTVERHFGLENYVFRKLIDCFESYFARQYMKVIRDYEQGTISQRTLHKEAAKATTDAQQFIGILYETMVMYYKLDKIKQDNITSFGKFINRDNVLNFLTSIVFKGKVYTTLFHLYRLEFLEDEVTYKKSVQACKHFKPEDFNVPEEYCLNEKTLEFFSKRKSQPSTTLLSIPTMTSFPGASTGLRLKRTSTSAGDELGEIDSKLFNVKKPYRNAVYQLRELKNMRSPLHKLKSIVETAEQVSKCIKDFYNGLGIVNENKLDPDQTLSIFMYLLAQSRLEHVSAHYKIIEKFSTNNVLNSVSGYYAATLGACVAYISEMGTQSEGERHKPDQGGDREGSSV